MFSRSNSASAPNTVSMKRPCGVVVPMFSFRLTNSTPFLASIERNLIVTGLYPNEIGRKKSGTFAPLNKSFKDVIQIADIISGAVFVVVDGLLDLFKGTSRIVTEIKERTCGSIESF